MLLVIVVSIRLWGCGRGGKEWGRVKGRFGVGKFDSHLNPFTPEIRPKMVPGKVIIGSPT